MAVDGQHLAQYRIGVKMKKVIPIIYYVFLAAGFLLIGFGMVLGETNIFNKTEETETVLVEPTEQKQISDDIRVFYLDIEESNVAGKAVMFYSHHHEAWVYADDRLIYSLDRPDSIFGETTGSVFNFVNLPPGVEQIRVVVEAIYPEERRNTIEFYMGDKISMYKNIIRESYWSMLLSMAGVGIGIFLIGYYLVVKRKSEIDYSALYFGIFGVVLGLWTMSETDFAIILLSNRTVASFTGFLLLMLAVVPFVLFVKTFLEVGDRYFAMTICILSFLNLVINTAGHLLGYWYFKKTVIITHLLLALGLCYMAYGIFWRIRKVGMDRKVKSSLIGVGVLAASMSIALISYYQGARQMDAAGEIGFLFYLIVLGHESIRDFLHKVDEGRKAEIYKELAVTDRLTGLYNRNAFDEWENKNTNFEDVMLVTFDLNNLKCCNDTMGHAAGDKYIVDAADLILQVFGSIGKCYRIGGDEFCAVIHGAEKMNIEEYYKKLEKKQERYNAHSKDIIMKIAHGHATFGKRDRTIEETRSRADARMYQHKRYSKTGE